MDIDQYLKLCKAVEAEEGIPIQHADLRILAALLREEAQKARDLAALSVPTSSGGRAFDHGFYRGRADAYADLSDKLDWILKGAPAPEQGPFCLRRRIGEE